MNKDEPIIIHYHPANDHAGPLLPEQLEVFKRNILSFLEYPDRLVVWRAFPAVIDVPELNARLRLQPLPSKALEVRYSFAPHLEEVAGANHYYMAPKEWFQNCRE